MSTALNDVVCELYREFYNDKRQSTRLRNFKKNPFRNLLIWAWKLQKIYAGSYKLRNSINNFRATEKKFPGTKIAIYTAVTGGYDTIMEPIYVDDELDYYVFTDSEEVIRDTKKKGSAWKAIPIPEYVRKYTAPKQNRYIKMHPDEFLKLTGRKYDYSVYIDGCFRITCDIKPLVYSLMEDGRTIAIHKNGSWDCPYIEAALMSLRLVAQPEEIRRQMDFYRSEGFPEHFGSLENPVIIRKCHDEELQRVMHSWWEQVERFTYRDQLSLPYVLWKSGKDISYIFPLGDNVWKSPYFITYEHGHIRKYKKGEHNH